MKKIINYLFSKGYYPRPSKLEISKKHKGIYLDPKHDEFRKALIDDIAKKMAENIDCLTQPVRNLEMKGEYNAIFRIYGDLMSLFLPEVEQKNSNYIDPIKRLMEEAKKKFDKKK